MKNMDKKTKYTVVFGGLALIISIIVIILINMKSRALFVIVNDRGYEYKNSSWSQINLSSQIFGKYRFHVYKGGEDKGEYELNYVNDRWYFFDDNNDSHRFDEGNLLAYHGDILFVPINVEAISNEDLDTINKALSTKDKSIVDLSELTGQEKVVFDFDNDSKQETIYSVNNLDKEDEDAFSALIYQNDDKVETVFYELENREFQDDLDLYTFNSMIRLNKSTTNNLIIEATKNLDSSSTDYLIYSFSKKGIKLEKGKSQPARYVRLTEKDYFGRTVLIVIIAVLAGIITVYFVIKNKKNKADEI